MDKITIAGKTFYKFIEYKSLLHIIKNLSQRLNTEFKEEEIIFLGVLNGSFMFCAELLKYISVKNQLSFIKLSSYEGNHSSGKVKQLIGLDTDISGKTVILLEDIVDSGITLDYLLESLKIHQAKVIFTTTLLFKPDAFKGRTKPQYIGMEIPDKFVLGFGLDYNGYGRNYTDIYALEENNK